MIKDIKITNQNEFETYFTSKSSFSSVADATTIAANSYAFNNALQAFRINDASDALKGSIEIPLGFLNIGDVVTITAEVMNVSGTKSKIAIDFFTANNYVVQDGNLFILQSEKFNQFEKIGGTFVSTKARYAKAILGVFTPDIGDYYIRNVEIKINGKGNLYTKATRHYTFTALANSFVLQTGYGEDTCTFTINSATKEFIITHDKPFTNYKLGVAFAGVSGSAPGKYIAKTKSEGYGGFTIRFYDLTLGDFVDPNVLFGTNTYFNCIHHGYDLA